jgi:hypothetical protein
MLTTRQAGMVSPEPGRPAPVTTGGRSARVVGDLAALVGNSASITAAYRTGLDRRPVRTAGRVARRRSVGPSTGAAAPNPAPRGWSSTLIACPLATSTPRRSRATSTGRAPAMMPSSNTRGWMQEPGSSAATEARRVPLPPSRQAWARWRRRGPPALAHAAGSRACSTVHLGRCRGSWLDRYRPNAAA